MPFLFSRGGIEEMLLRHAPSGDRILGSDEDEEFAGWSAHLAVLRKLREQERVATEHTPEAKRGLYSSFPQMGPAVGFLLANGLFLVLTATLSSEQFASWGWRIPFLVSLVLVLVGLYVRATIAETPIFSRAVE